jgi:hypothetical protein
VSALTGADIALVRWRGDDDALLGHQWRSAAAVVGGLLSTDHGQGRSLTHRRAPLRPPRAGQLDRRAQLSPHRRQDEAPAAPSGFPSEVSGEPAHVASLRKLAAGFGITVTGWESLQVQAGPMGGIGSSATCLKIAKALDADKVANLNAGRATTGGNLPAAPAAPAA